MFGIGYEIDKFVQDSYFEKISKNFKKGQQLPPPSYVAWDATRRCNLHCLHCGASKERYDDELKTNDLKSLIDELGDMKVKNFGATGGEPLLRKDFFEIFDYAKQKGLATTLASNGFLIDESMSKKIKDVGISSVQISIDGNEEIHNEIRGNKLSFEKMINAFKNLKNDGIPLISASTVVSAKNIESLEKIRDILLDIGIKYRKIIVPMPIGRAQDNGVSIAYSQIQNIFKFIFQNKDKMNIDVGENLPYLGSWEKKIRRHPMVCTVGFNVCCVGVGGNVRGCPEQPDILDFIEGNIKEKSFEEIWQKGFGKYRNREIYDMDSKCSNCFDKYYCYGGCRVMRQGNCHCIKDLQK